MHSKWNAREGEKKMKKKTVAFLMVFALIVGILPIGLAKTAEAAEGFEEMALSDFGILDITSSGEKGYKASDESLIGKSVKGIYNFANGSVLAFGNNSWYTFTLSAFNYAGNNYLVAGYWDPDGSNVNGSPFIYAKDIGGVEPLGSDLEIEACFDFVKNEADEKGTLTVTLIINGQYTFVYTWSNVGVANLTESIYTRGTSYTLTDAAYNNAEELTPEDFGVNGLTTLGTNGTLQTDTPNESLDGKKVTGVYGFTNGSSLVYGRAQWAHSIIMTAYDYNGNQYIVPQIWNGSLRTPHFRVVTFMLSI